MTGGERFVGDARRAVTLGSALLAVVCLSALVIPSEPLPVERAWSEAMRDMQTPVLDHVALAFNAAGRGLGVVLAVTAVALLLSAQRRRTALVAFLAVEGATQASSSLLKALVGRPRPPHGLVDPVGSSFPSGHATYAGATCVALVFLFVAVSRRRSWAWMLAATGILGMAWSRTYLQVHWLLDVVAGSLLGIGFALVVFAAVQLSAASAASRGQR